MTDPRPDDARWFTPSVTRPQPVAIAEWLRRSLFVIPACGVLVGTLGAVAASRATWIDVGWVPTVGDTTVTDARTILGAIATGTITALSLVLTVSLVAVQLAAGQLSPRTVPDYLGHRFQQVTIAVVLGTAAYSLSALRTVGGSHCDFQQDEGFACGLCGPNHPDVRALIASLSAAFVAWQAGVDPTGEAWVTIGGERYLELVADGAIGPL